MKFVIFDDGNLVDSFEDETEALKALAELAAVAEAEPHLLLVAFDASGELVADYIPGERLVIPA
ncbi:MAG: hypothetical protein ABSH51_13275 [Solirubrobacteraceae bacterium]